MTEDQIKLFTSGDKDQVTIRISKNLLGLLLKTWEIKYPGLEADKTTAICYFAASRKYWEVSLGGTYFPLG